MKDNDMLLYAAAAAAVYFLFIKQKPQTPGLPPGVTAVNPVNTSYATSGGSSVLATATTALSNLLNNIKPQPAFAPQPIIQDTPAPGIDTSDLVLSNQIAVSPTANVTDQNVRNMINSDFYTQYQQGFISGYIQEEMRA